MAKSTKERDELARMVAHFCWSDGNRCWPTVKRWTVKEAEDALREQAKKAQEEALAEALDGGAYAQCVLDQACYDEQCRAVNSGKLDHELTTI